MKKKITGIFVFTIMITVVVSPVTGVLNFKKTKTDGKNVFLREAELNQLNDNIAHVGYLNCTSWYSPVGDFPQVKLESNAAHVIWLEGSGCIQATWKIKISPGDLFFGNMIVYRVGFYLRVWKKNNEYLEKKFEDVITVNDEKSAKLTICVDLNENDYNKVGDEYKIECELKAEVAGFLFRVLHIFQLHDQDKGYPNVWIKDSSTSTNYELIEDLIKKCEIV